MKNIITIACIFTVSFIIPSCLDVDPPGRYSDEQVWASIRNLDYSIRGFYQDAFYSSYVSELSAPERASDGFADLFKATRGSMATNRFFSVVDWLNVNNTLSPWDASYASINRMNDFLVAYNDGVGDELDHNELSIRVAEVRFLRAFIYQTLVIRHGGVILRIDETRLDGPERAMKARASTDECWDFIIEEYEKAALILPEEWVIPTVEYGRLTKGSAYGMIARAALYAGRWDKAIEAAGEVTKLAEEGRYQLLPNFANIFTTANNKELLTTVYYSSNNGHLWDNHFCPSGDQQVFGTIYIGGLIQPTDEFASSYDIKVGATWRTFSWDDVENGIITDPWANRDPRFAATFLYNGAVWRNRPLQLYVGGQDGFIQYAETGLEDMRRSVTGYVLRKFLSTEINWTNIQRSKEYWVIMRYAEVLLIKSEAHARKGEMTQAYEYLNQVRTRAGMPALPQRVNWDGYFRDLQKERICELGGEGHRFWDLRRWGIAADVLNGSRTHGVRITRTVDDNDVASFSYQRVEADVSDRMFPEKYNIFPIPDSEVQRNTLCEQDNIWK